jgi:hypothetical protein
LQPCYTYIAKSMERWSSWFKAPVLKTGVGSRPPWVRIPVSPPYYIIKFDVEKYSSRSKRRPC